MIERQLTLCTGGRVALPGYACVLPFGYAHNAGVYRLRVAQTGEWEGLTVRAFWHRGGSAEPLVTLVTDGGMAVPARITAQSGPGTLTFEGSDGSCTVTSASVPFLVRGNAGTDDPDMPEPGTPAWQLFLEEVRKRSGGLSGAEKALLLALLEAAAYTDETAQANLAALKALWSDASTPDTPDTPTQPDTPDPDPDPEPDPEPTAKVLYALPKATVFTGADGEQIDTQLTPLKTNESFSIALTASGNAAVSLHYLYICMRNSSPWPGLALYPMEKKLQQALQGKDAASNNSFAKEYDLTGSYTLRYVLTYDAEKALYAVRFRFNDGEVETNQRYCNISEAALSEHLFLGGTTAVSGYGWVGTIADFTVYGECLTEEAALAYLNRA